MAWRSTWRGLTNNPRAEDLLQWARNVPGHLHSWSGVEGRAWLSVTKYCRPSSLFCCCLVPVMSVFPETPWTVAHQSPLSTAFPTKNTGLSYHFFLQGIFPIHWWNPHLLLGRWILYNWATWGNIYFLQFWRLQSVQTKSPANLASGDGMVCQCPSCNHLRWKGWGSSVEPLFLQEIIPFPKVPSPDIIALAVRIST